MNLFLRVNRRLLAGCLLLAAQPLLAQTERGTGWWSGGFNWQTGKTDLFQNRIEQTTLTLSVTQGTFIRDNILVGADLRLTRTRDLARQGFNFDAVTDLRLTTFSATPFVRRFWGKEALRGYVGGGLSVGFGRDRLLSSNTKQRVSERETSRWQVTPQFQAGLFYTIDSRWGIELATRSALAPLAFGDLSLGLVLVTDAKKKGAAPAPKQTPTQLLTGNWILGGTFDFGKQQQQLTSGGDQLTTVQRRVTGQYTVVPSVGYMPGNRWIVGVSVPYRQQKLTNQFSRSANDVQTGTVVTESIGVEPFAKKYFSKSHFGPFVGARAGWRSERVSGDGTAPTQAPGYSWRVSGGLAYLLGNHFIMEGELGGIGSDWSTTQQTDDARRNTNIALTLRPALTITYVF